MQKFCSKLVLSGIIFAQKGRIYTLFVRNDDVKEGFSNKYCYLCIGKTTDDGQQTTELRFCSVACSLQSKSKYYEKT